MSTTRLMAAADRLIERRKLEAAADRLITRRRDEATRDQAAADAAGRAVAPLVADAVAAAIAPLVEALHTTPPAPTVNESTDRLAAAVEALAAAMREGLMALASAVASRPLAVPMQTVFHRGPDGAMTHTTQTVQTP